MGVVQELAELLRRLKAGDHKALIFTQMARMLDILEVSCSDTPLTACAHVLCYSSLSPLFGRSCSSNGQRILVNALSMLGMGAFVQRLQRCF